LKEDARFATRMDRVNHQDLLATLLQERIAQRTVQDLSDDLVARGVVASPIYRADQLVEDPQVKHRGLFFDVPHPTAGSVTLSASPIRMSETPVDRYVAPPTIGQHCDEVLGELLGYTEAERAALKAEGAI
jgi:crotonobetainyl-CoA:carnitine CoA-transferase CaiB-like acyl-CoA transferase